MNYILPRLPNANDFEELVRDVFSVKLKNPNLQRYGRSGQKQQGIDIIGIAGRDYTNSHGVIIQCKNHTVDVGDEKIISEINDELAKFDLSIYKENDYYFVTSASNSTGILDHIKQINETRESKGESHVEVMFWEDICRDLLDNQKLFHKYYGNSLNVEAPQDLDIVDDNFNTRQTLHKNLSQFDTLEKAKHIVAELKEICAANLGANYQKVDPYNLYLGVSTHAQVNFDQRTDLDIDASEFFADTDKLDDKYQKIVLCLNNLANVLSDSFFSDQLTILSDSQINFSLLMGKVFRKYRRKLHVKFDGKFLTTELADVSCSPSKVVEKNLIHQSTSNNHEDLVFILNIARETNITQAVMRHISQWSQPFVLRSYGLINGNNIESSAHALAIAEDIGMKLHGFQDSGLGIRRLHLFIAAPKPLALLIGHELNTLNTEIYMYFFNPDRTDYLRTGILKNNTF